MADLAEAIRILAGHVGMSADARRRLAIALDDEDPRKPPPVPIDPRDEELARLRAQLAGQSEVSTPAKAPRQRKAPVGG